MKVQRGRNNILFFCSYQAPYGGNFISSLLELEKRLNLLGYKCIYVFPVKAAKWYWYEQLKMQGKTIAGFDFDRNKFQILRGIQALLEKYQVKILHVHFGELIATGLIGLLNRKVKVVWHLHSDFSMGKQHLSLKSRVSDFLNFKVLNHFVTMISVSEFLAKKSKGIYWVPNGIAKERFSQKNYTRKEMRAFYDIADHESLVLLFAWSPVVKGLDIAVEAVSLLHSQGDTDIKLGVICGREYVKEKMKTYVNSNTSCSGNEHWIVYLEPIEDVFQYHRASDLMLSVSRSEGFSYSILEALTIGNKCAVSDIPGVKWSKQYNLVFPFESQNVNSCAEAIKTAIRSDISEKLNIATQVSEKYSIEKWCDRIIRIYEITSD